LSRPDAWSGPGLRQGQLAQLAARVAAAIGDVVRPGGSPAVIGLYKSVAMVVTLMRANVTRPAGPPLACDCPAASRRAAAFSASSLASSRAGPVCSIFGTRVG
jgi:hypothetical protein